MFDSGYAVSQVIFFCLTVIVLIVTLIGVTVCFKARIRRGRLAKRDFYAEIREAISRKEPDSKIIDLFALALEDAETRGSGRNLRNFVKEQLENHDRCSLAEVLAT